ncbi:hypothetical protein [Rhodanobacter umsongensis]
MERAQQTASIEFLEFLAHISNSATGEISFSMLAGSLQMSDQELLQRWDERGRSVAWPMFADEILAVLDAAQDITFNFARTVAWYRHEPIESFGMRSADQVVAAGGARRLAFLIAKRDVQIR